MYLEVADSDNLPYGWSRFAQFSLAVVNQINYEHTVRKYFQLHKFTARESDWGSTKFIPLSELYDPSRGYLVDDTCIVEVDVITDYDSREETDYVGLKNQGATCYLNSLLQTLYHIPYFRKAVYHMPTTENDLPSESIPLALQSLFYKLQYGKNSVGTKELAKSFGWNAHEYSFMQHDVQELNRVLCEKLENKMKGTLVEGTIQQLFEGHYMNYTECINVDYRSTRKESFYDLQLDVKGCRDVYASFNKYVEVERLEGDNKYHAGQPHGLQDAKKGLNRYEFDFVRDTMVKINDRYEFPLQLDLDREDGKYLSPDADRRVRNLYALYGVFVCSGGVHGGHYCAFIRPTLSEQWFKFDDEWVTKEDVKWALEEQYGEEEFPQTNPEFNHTPFKFTKYSNAYMLVYIRESDKDKIMSDAHLYTIIKVARNEDLFEQIGRDVYFDLVDQKKFAVFEVAKEFGVSVQYHRFWFWAKRQNRTYRPYRPLTLQEETQSVEQISTKAARNAELELFLEVEIGPKLDPIPPPCYKTKEDILLFFKLYDPEKEEIRYVGRLIVKGSGKPLEILKKLNEMAGFPPDEEIQLYEEISFEPTVICEHIDKNLTFCDNQLEDGDIICFQKPASAHSMTPNLYHDVTSFLEYVHNLQLSKVLTYDDVTETVARHLGLDDPTKIILTAHNCYSQNLNPHAIKYKGFNHLSEILIHHNRTSNILYYEFLDIPLPEFQDLKTLKVAFHHSTKDDMVFHSITLPKQSTVGDLINDLKTKIELSHPDAELRLLEISYHRISKIFPLSEKIVNISDEYWTLRAEEIPEEEKNLGHQDRLIRVYHFTIEFWNPFFLVIHDGETLHAAKFRMQKKLQVSDEEFAKWKFATLSLLHPPEYLQDSDIVLSRFQPKRCLWSLAVPWLEHSHLISFDSSPKRECAASNNLQIAG
ncbi:hypothetical protein MKW92_032897 [Papaver armeniacum]|nr:hypothetical protein MKW92_032897 [Papaver armeniacum]